MVVIRIVRRVTRVAHHGERFGNRRDDEGFTLVELAVAMVILVILVGIAIPTFLGTRAGSADQAAKSAAMTALKAQQVVYSDGKGYADLDAVRKAEPGVKVDDLPEVIDDEAPVPEVLGVVYVRTDDEQVVVVSRSRSGQCFWARDRAAIAAFAQNDCTSSPEFTTSW